MSIFMFTPFLSELQRFFCAYLAGVLVISDLFLQQSSLSTIWIQFLFKDVEDSLSPDARFVLLGAFLSWFEDQTSSLLCLFQNSVSGFSTTVGVPSSVWSSKVIETIKFKLFWQQIYNKDSV